MTNLPDPSQALVPVQSTGAAALPQIVRRAGQAAVFAAEEFFLRRHPQQTHPRGL